MNNNINFPTENNYNVNENLYLGSGTYGVVFKSGTGKFVKKITLFEFDDQENIDKIINIRNVLTNKYKNKTYKYFIIPYQIDTVLSYEDLSKKIRTTVDKNLILQKVRHMFYERTGVFQEIKKIEDFLYKVYKKRNKNNINHLSKLVSQKISFEGKNNKEIQNILTQIMQQYEVYLKQQSRIQDHVFAIEYSHFWPQSQDLFTLKSLTEENCMFMIETLIKEVKLLHECNIFHNDLKPENIVVSFEKEKWYPRILDFGLSMIIDAKHPHITKMVMFGTFSFLPTDILPNPLTMTQIIKKYHRFTIKEEQINNYNNFLISEWNKVCKNNNKVHEKELTKKILFYNDIFCLALCFQSCISKLNNIKPKWLDFLNYCCGADTPNQILTIDDIENKFKEMNRNNK